MPGYFFFFGGYEVSKLILTNGHPEQAGLPVTIVAGGVGGVCLWTSIFPFDVVKSRIQIQSSRERMITVLLRILRVEGIQGLYNGLTPTLLRTFPSTGALFVAYEYSRQFMLTGVEKVSLFRWKDSRKINGICKRSFLALFAQVPSDGLFWSYYLRFRSKRFPIICFSLCLQMSTSIHNRLSFAWLTFLFIHCQTIASVVSFCERFLGSNQKTFNLMSSFLSRIFESHHPQEFDRLCNSIQNSCSKENGGKNVSLFAYRLGHELWSHSEVYSLFCSSKVWIHETIMRCKSLWLHDYDFL